MKQIFKNFSKLLSVLLVVAIGFISFTACSKNKESNTIPSVENAIESADSSTQDNTATDVNDSTDDENSQTSSYPITPGFYKHTNLNLTFNDIYYFDKEKVLSFFETRDINGVYHIVQGLGFDNFVKNITTHTNDKKVEYEKIVNFNKNETLGTQLAIYDSYEVYPDCFVDLKNSTVYDVIDGEISVEISKPQFIIDKETNTVSILYPFHYKNASNKIVYTPLFVKSDVTLYNKVDIMAGDEFNSSYQYYESSAKIQSINGFVNETEAYKKLNEMLNIEEDENITDCLNNVEAYITNDKEVYVLYTEDVVILTQKFGNTYSIYNSFVVNIVNEYYDITLDMNILTIEIEIDENTYFTCQFYA